MEIKRERRWSTVYQAASETETQETQEALVLFLAFYPSAPLFPLTLLSCKISEILQLRLVPLRAVWFIQQQQNCHYTPGMQSYTVVILEMVMSCSVYLSSVMCLYTHNDTRPKHHNCIYLLPLSGCVRQLGRVIIFPFLCWEITVISEAFTVWKEFKHSLQDSLSFWSMTFHHVTQLSEILWQDPPASSHSIFPNLVYSE